MGQLKGKNDMWNYILSGLRMFVFTPVLFVMAIVTILLCIIQDMILFLFRLIWNQLKRKSGYTKF